MLEFDFIWCAYFLLPRSTSTSSPSLQMELVLTFEANWLL